MRNFYNNVNRKRKFKSDFKLYNKLDQSGRFENKWSNVLPCLHDNGSLTGFDAHYIYHPAWAARVVKDINPDKHIDISSTLTFCSQLSAFIPTEFYDFRPAKLSLDNLISEKADLTDLNFQTDSISSLSCLHTIEHIGLGRYGDQIDPDGDLKAIAELKRVCTTNGNLLIVVPVGKEKILFNAHRIYNAKRFIHYFDGFYLKEFSLVLDDGSFLRDCSLENAAGENYGCGCFWFVKK